MNSVRTAERPDWSTGAISRPSFQRVTFFRKILASSPRSTVVRGFALATTTLYPGGAASGEAIQFTASALEALVRMKLTSFRDKDRTHLRDLVEVRLIDQSWTSRLPAPLGACLQSLLGNPDG